MTCQDFQLDRDGNHDVPALLDCRQAHSAPFEGATRKPPAMQEVDYFRCIILAKPMELEHLLRGDLAILVRIRMISRFIGFLSVRLFSNYKTVTASSYFLA